jgi:hypothetical protein
VLPRYDREVRIWDRLGWERRIEVARHTNETFGKEDEDVISA